MKVVRDWNIQADVAHSSAATTDEQRYQQYLFREENTCFLKKAKTTKICPHYVRKGFGYYVLVEVMNDGVAGLPSDSVRTS
jgi:hypothetical protein